MDRAASKIIGVMALGAALLASGAVQAQTKPAAEKPPIMLRAEPTNSFLV